MQLMVYRKGQRAAELSSEFKLKNKIKIGSLHVEVLLGVLDVPLDFSVYVKVKLLGHW